MGRRPVVAHGERGNALVEAALVTPLFLLFVLAVIDGGYGFHERLSVSNMAMAGARSASGRADDGQADHRVLRAVKANAGGIDAGQVQAIVVYKAWGPGAEVPESCRVASVEGLCNRYVGADLSRPVSDFGCTGPPGPAVKIDDPWCPRERKTALTGPEGPPDYVGVFVHASHRNLTGVLGSGLAFGADVVMRIEPRSLR